MWQEPLPVARDISIAVIGFLPAAEPSGLWIVISQLEGGPW